MEDKYYFEIPDSLFGREILVVNRISKAPAGLRSGGSFFGYAGDQIGQNVVKFEKGPNNKIFLRNISFAEYAKDSTSPMFTTVNNSNVQPIAASFDVKSLGKDSTGAVIDKNAIDAAHFVQRQVSDSRAGIDQRVVIVQERRGPAVLGDGAGAA